MQTMTRTQKLLPEVAPGHASVVIESARASAAKARLGAVLRGRWELRELLGIGAMAAVYLAVHRNGSRVAVKVFDPLPAAHRDELLQRFLREAYLANKVNHPGVVKVFDDDVTSDGAPFMVMELLEGETLASLLAREGSVSPGRALAIGVEILDALAAAHAAGVVHRDIKPGNVVACRDGRIKLVDFGIARSRDGAVTSLTCDGLVMGTPAFMPPEQAAGNHEAIGPWTDVWAVGALLYALLTGVTVRDDAPNTSIAFCDALWKPVPSIRTRRADLPIALVEVVERALRFEGNARWPSALAMRDALKLARASTPTYAATLQMPSRTELLPAPIVRRAPPSARDVPMESSARACVPHSPSSPIEVASSSSAARWGAVLLVSVTLIVTTMLIWLAFDGDDERKAPARAVATIAASTEVSVSLPAPSRPTEADNEEAAQVEPPPPVPSAIPRRAGPARRPNPPRTFVPTSPPAPPVPTSPPASTMADPLSGARF